MIKKLLILLAIVLMYACRYSKTENVSSPEVRILFLHHSTGNCVWKGDERIFNFLSDRHNEPIVPWLISEYNKQHKTKYAIEERNFPKAEPYGWKNYPYDYYNIWVKHAGNIPYMEEPTLEMLTRDYDVIIFKHCFPGSSIQPDDSLPNINSEKKTISNYKLQYQAIREKLTGFPETKFIVWTGAALVGAKTNHDQAVLADNFAKWVKDEWDKPGDNIFIWDFRQLETEGGLFLKPQNARSKTDSHPSEKFSERVAKNFVTRVISVIENNGNDTDLAGNKK